MPKDSASRGAAIGAFASAPLPVSDAPPTAKPKDADDLARLIDWARKSTVTLQITSTGLAPDAVLEADLVVDLGDMDQVFQVDAEDAVAIIGPGVTYDALDAALKPHGLRSFKPLRPAAGQSVIASYLDREPLTNVRENWDILDPFGSAQLVFGTGETFYTGPAAHPGTMKEHWASGLRYMTATGPAGTDFMRVVQGSQGALGAVTWAAMFCDRIPQAEASYFIASPDVAPLLTLMGELNYRRLAHGVFLSNGAHLSQLAAQSGLAFQSGDATSWILSVNLAASCTLSEGRLAFEKTDLLALASAAGLSAVSDLDGLSAQDLFDAQGTLSDTDWRAGAGSVFFLTQADRLPVFTALLTDFCAANGIAEGDCAVYVQPRLQGRNAHVEFVLPTGETDALAQAICDAGGLFSRPRGTWRAMEYAKNPGLLDYLKHTKSMFDPDGVLAPGRLGL